MKKNQIKKSNKKEIIYSIRYDSLNPDISSSRANPLLARKSQYQLREASNRYLFRVERILRREGFNENGHMYVQFNFLRRKR
ncbi:hypothetical protein FJZ20_02640 [Candidatus Pacearchaeota archaeon]|nr:hypothetical protein [Candidatus Pacearchaeota archaeon]